jgi:hypothetical protein
VAAIKLPAPGTEYGPCLKPCSHVGCAMMHNRAAELCNYCGKPIGYETRFYVIDQRAVHSACEEDAVNAACQDMLDT